MQTATRENSLSWKKKKFLIKENDLSFKAKHFKHNKVQDDR
jgi:hypothetical protein